MMNIKVEKVKGLSVLGHSSQKKCWIDYEAHSKPI